MPNFADILREALLSVPPSAFPRSPAGGFFAGLASGARGAEAHAREDVLSNIIRGGLNLTNTPENLPPPNLPPMQFSLGDVGAQSTPVPPQNNPAHDRILRDIIGASSVFTRMGGDPNRLVDVLGKLGVYQTPMERTAMEATKRQTELQQKQFEQQTKERQGREGFRLRLQNDARDFSAAREKSRQEFLKSLKMVADSGKITPGQAISQRAHALKALDDQLREEWAGQRLALYQQNNDAILPSFGEWKKGNGWTDARGKMIFPDELKQLESDAAYLKYMKDLLGGVSSVGPTAVPADTSNATQADKYSRATARLQGQP